MCRYSKSEPELASGPDNKLGNENFAAAARCDTEGYPCENLDYRFESKPQV